MIVGIKTPLPPSSDDRAAAHDLRHEARAGKYPKCVFEGDQRVAR